MAPLVVDGSSVVDGALVVGELLLVVTVLVVGGVFAVDIVPTTKVDRRRKDRFGLQEEN